MIILKKSSIKVLETERLILRPFRRSDAKAMFKNWANDPQVMRYLSANVSNSIEEVHTRLDSWFSYFNDIDTGSWGMYAIVLKSTGVVIGEIDFAELDTDNRSAEVGYQIGKAWWGQGYVAEALKRLIRYCFVEVGLKKIWGDFDARNINSGKVMVKAGMKHEKTTERISESTGETVTRVRYAITAENYFVENK